MEFWIGIDPHLGQHPCRNHLCFGCLLFIEQTAYADYKANGCKFSDSSGSTKKHNSTSKNNSHNHSHNKPERLSGRFNNKHDSSRTTPSNSTVTTPTTTTKTPTSSYYAGPKFLTPPLPSMLPMPPVKLARRRRATLPKPERLIEKNCRHKVFLLLQQNHVGLALGLSFCSLITALSEKMQHDVCLLGR